MTTTNAKEEFLELTNQARPQKLLGARLIIGDLETYSINPDLLDDDDLMPVDCILPENYSVNELLTFLDKIDKDYYPLGAGMRRVFGYIWFGNGVWAERVCNDRSEWWELRKYPNMDVNRYCSMTRYADNS